MLGALHRNDAEIPDHRSCITCLSHSRLDLTYVHIIILVAKVLFFIISYGGLGYEHLIDMLSCINPSGQARKVSILIIRRPTEIIIPFSSFSFSSSVGLHVAAILFSSFVHTSFVEVPPCMNVGSVVGLGGLQRLSLYHHHHVSA